MNGTQTTVAIQRYLNELAGLPIDSPAEPVVRELLGKAAQRLHLLCGAMLHRSYARLTQPPLSLESDDMLGGVVERLLKALREVRPSTVAGFFALANQHMRWQLNDLARRLDERTPMTDVDVSLVPAPASSGSALSWTARHMLEAIDNLPEDEREVFGLVRIQGMTHTDAADVLGVSVKTVQRRLNRSLLMLTEALGDLRPSPPPSS